MRPSFLSPDWICPLNRGVPKERFLMGLKYVTFHRSRVQVTAALINYQTTQIPLNLTEHFVKRLGLGDAIHLSISW